MGEGLCAAGHSELRRGRQGRGQVPWLLKANAGAWILLYSSQKANGSFLSGGVTCFLKFTVVPEGTMDRQKQGQGEGSQLGGCHWPREREVAGPPAPGRLVGSAQQPSATVSQAAQHPLSQIQRRAFTPRAWPRPPSLVAGSRARLPAGL